MTEIASERARWVCEAADKRKALGLMALDVRSLTIICDYFIICHGRSLIHVDAIAEGIEEAMEERGIRPLASNRLPDAKWVVLDYGDVVVHVFTEEARSHYDLEGLWSQAKQVDLGLFLPELPAEEME